MPSPGSMDGGILRREWLLVRVKTLMVADAYGRTQREAKVYAHIILGYTVLGTSMALDITTDTVPTHRKRAYAKMAISSGNELFARYFTAVEHTRSN